MAPPALDLDYVEGKSDNLPKVDIVMLMEFAAAREDYISAEIKNIKSERAMRRNYTSAAVGRVSLRRANGICSVKAEVCPEHRQRNSNYRVTLVVDETTDIGTVTDLQCHDCVAARGGCKHALAFLMWMHEKTMEPSPTDVTSYWKKPKLSNISATAQLCTTDFGLVHSTTAVDKEKFLLAAMNPPKPVDSMFQRYHTELNAIERLDIRQLCANYVISKQKKNLTPSDFLNFCSLAMSDRACEEAYNLSKLQANSRYWHLLRYGRITASNLHSAARSKTPNGGTLKERILGAATIPFSPAMDRGKKLESGVLAYVQEKEKIRILPAGLQLSREFGHLGATPDGLSTDYVVEVKCPFFVETVKNYYDGKDVVNDKFMAQMQLQMKFCNRKKGLFCVASPTFEKKKAVKIIPVDYDENLVNSLIKESTVYWAEHIFPTLLEASL